MLGLLLAVLLMAHLLLVDLAMAGPLVCVWVEWRAGRRGEAESVALAHRLAVWSLVALVVGSALGGVLLTIRYLANDEAYLTALAAIPRDRIWFGLAELAFAIGCATAYVLLWGRLRQHRAWHRLFAVAGASNAMIHFPMLFAVISVVSTRPQLAAASLDRTVYRGLLVDGEVLSRVVHVWLAAAAVAGLVLAALAVRSPEGDLPARQRGRLLRGGARLALGATLAQLPAGLWLVMEMPARERRPLMGEDWLATGLFAASLLLSMALLHVLWALSLGESDRRQVRRALAVMAVLVLLMAGTRVRLESRPSLGSHAASARAADRRPAARVATYGSGAARARGGNSPCIIAELGFNRGRQ